MAETILGITGKLTAVAELIADIDPDRLSAAELQVLRERLPQWDLTLGATRASVKHLEHVILPPDEG